MRKRILCLFLAVLLTFTLVGCGNTQREEGEYQVFYMNREMTKLVPETYDSKETSGEKLAAELLQRLSEPPYSSKLVQTLPSSLRVNEIKVDGSYLAVDFNEAYKELSVTEEILVRAAVVRTLLQIEEYSLIAFTVNSEPLRAADGTLIGNMTTDSFVENPGAQINASAQTSLKLYFANADGTKLVEEQRNVTYNTSISMEKLIMEQLIDGPRNSEGQTTIPANTKLVNISIADGVCYVALDNTFKNQNPEILEEVVLYSIVNSLTEMSTVSKVQISINGSTDGFCRYSLELSKLYQKNPELVEKDEPESTEGEE